MKMLKILFGLLAIGLWQGGMCAVHAEDAAYVVLGEGRTAEARLITQAPRCPDIVINGRKRQMQARALPATEPQRPTQSRPEFSKPSVFDVRVCEAPLPAETRSALIEGHRLPVRKSRLDRLVVIGDTGCRLKAADNAWQACNDPAAFPFARIARQVAAWHPDAVIHVGDYEYRENPCPDDQAGCAGSPWGYGWDAWKADFFTPGAPILRSAPLILARGNHESCSRAGQGWWRFLDPRPLELHRDCNDPAFDVTGDYSAPYAVDFGGGAQIAVMDLSHAGGAAIPQDDPRFAAFTDTYDRLAAMTKKARFTFAVDHYPFLAVSADEKTHALFAGNKALASTFGTRNPYLMPEGVDVLLAGHVHLWEQVSYRDHFPSQFVAGFSGTQEDIVPLPVQVPAGIGPVPGAVIDQFSSWIDGFGFMTLERTSENRWRVEVHDGEGRVVNRCRIIGRASVCDQAAVAAIR
ncbi:metallophosphoesterase family protein [Asticcacaulis taihuensis]|uniref:Calcineurin-like phosphoesterase n=1 Tax=Asticcacaulis taihuensis TaxID=260084 RepID=A0A1G4RU30_9CAUL|nr:metallophosphoesterase [Asticcacaulis taihuensis]SCW60221.1 Calcineurin-like phosphoesterase [Asticcacaulis taihuensis]